MIFCLAYLNGVVKGEKVKWHFVVTTTTTITLPSIHDYLPRIDCTQESLQVRDRKECFACVYMRVRMCVCKREREREYVEESLSVFVSLSERNRVCERG